MKQPLAWFEGTWGDPSELTIPISERGLQLADGLFETVLVLNGIPRFLKEHLNRWQISADLLGMEPPPPQGWLEPLIEAAIQRSGLNQQNGALRLNWSRGCGQSRGIGLPKHSKHRFWLTLQAHELNWNPITTIISSQEQRNVHSVLSRCKTFAYNQAIQARREAERHGVDDALLRNTQSELCCGTVANLMVLRSGEWLTPPLSSGCLPGVMRGRAIKLGLAREISVGPDVLPQDSAILLNSLGCRTISSISGKPLTSEASTAQKLWKQLLSQ
ncbi:MAG: 4-amino-4-deoxychorismate lyase [Cyanobium sp. NAT70]|nr:4-amino-4-deoxychorismate lyase [Cyanobium sp. NAT70]